MRHLIYFLSTNLLPVISALLAIHLQAQAQMPELTVPVGHQDLISSVDFSSNGKWIVTGSHDNSFILWDARTNFIIRSTKTEYPVQQVLFTADGQYVLVMTGQTEAVFTSKQKNAVFLYETLSGAMIKKLPFSASPGMRFLSSGSALLVTDYTNDLSDRQSTIAQTISDRIEAARKRDSIIDAGGTEKPDPLEEAMEKEQDDMQEEIESSEQSNPEKAKWLTEEMFSPDKASATLFHRNYALIDAKNYVSLISITDLPEKLALLSYKGEEYLLKGQNTLLPTEKKIVAWPVQQLITTGSQHRNVPAPVKQFRVKNAFSVLAASAAKGFFATGEDDEPVRLWQFDKENPIATLQSAGSDLESLRFSADGERLYVLSSKAHISFLESFHTGTFKRIFYQQLPDAYAGTEIWLSPEKYIVTLQQKGLLKIFPDDQHTEAMQARAGRVGYYGFKDHDSVVYANYNGIPDMSAFFRAFALKEVEFEAKQQGRTLTSLQKDQMVDQKLKGLPAALTTPGHPGSFLLDWDLERGGAHLHPANTFSINGRDTSADRKYVLSCELFESASHEYMKSINMILNSGKKTGNGESAISVEKLVGLSDSNILYANAVNKNSPVLFLTNLVNKDTVRLINIDSSDWIMLHNGYYMTSQNGAKALGYTRGMDVFPFDQFDIQFNRPDLVLKAIGKADPLLIEAYRNAYEKRIEKLGIDTSQFQKNFHAPEADFSNRDSISHNQTTGTLHLQVKGQDKKAVLDRLNVWVNGVPVYGLKGKNLRQDNSRSVNTSVDIILSPGSNRLETSVLNENLVESYRVPLFVNYNPKVHEKEKVFFIGIGISEFADSSHNLRYCDKDIRDIDRQLKRKYEAQLKSSLLLNEAVTTERVKALKQMLLTANENDIVIIAYSGHGLLNDKLDYYLSTWPINFKNPGEKGLPYEELEDLFDGIKARKKLLLIDACHSGEVDKDALLHMKAFGAGAKKMVQNPGNTVQHLQPSSGYLGLDNSFQLMQELFVNISRRTGTTVIAAAAGTALAQEGRNFENGTFTHCILELLQQDKPVTVSKLKQYVNRRVSELSGGFQQPITRNENVTFDWTVW